MAEDQDEAAFAAFLKRVDEVVAKASATSFGREDFVDAAWRDLFEEDPECDDQAIIDTLTDVDVIFADMVEIAGG